MGTYAFPLPAFVAALEAGQVYVILPLFVIDV